MPDRPTVYVVDDDQSLRRAVVWLLESVGHRVKEFESAEDFLVEFENNPFGCLLTDMRMPKKSGLNLIEDIRSEDESFPIIVMTAYGTVKSGVRAMKLGALDYLEKPFDDQQLLDLINDAVEMARKGRHERSLRHRLASGIALLSARERQVLEGIMMGKKNTDIADDLTIGIKTVETYRSRILAKTGCDTIGRLCMNIEKHRIPISQ